MSEVSRRFLAPALRAWLVPLSLASLGVVGWACRDSGDGDDAACSSRRSDSSFRCSEVEGVLAGDVLHSIGSQVIVPATAEFVTGARALEDAVAAWAEAIETGDAEASKHDAELAWIAAMDQWQRIEVMQVGPAAPSLVDAGGEDLRDTIYSWPTTDTCSVDRALVGEDYAAPDFFTTALVWAYGLDALEYLVFAQGSEHTCPAQVQLDAPWDALGEQEIARRRSAYARVIAAGVATQAQVLADRWAAAEDGGFAFSLLARDDSPYADDTEALDAVFRAMFYLELQTKDAKLGMPSGAVAGCAAVPCVEQLELPHSHVGAHAAIANLEGLRLMFQGGRDPESADGFDDLLEEIGQAEIASTLLQRIEVAIATFEAHNDSLQSQLVSDPDVFAAHYEAVKDVTDVLKGPVVMALRLTVPTEGAGDAD